MNVLVDTGVFIAYFIRQDADHDRVSAVFKKLLREHAVFYTSSFILDELFTWSAYHQSPIVTTKIMDAVSRLETGKELRVLDVDQSVRDAALPLFKKFLQHKISFTDATSAILLKTNPIDSLFTLDSNFRKIGLRNLLTF